MIIAAPSTNFVTTSVLHNEYETVYLRMLDTDAVIRSNSSTFLARLRQSYTSFIVAEGDLRAEQIVECGLFIGRDNAWGKPILFVGEEEFYVPETDTVPDELLLSVLISKLTHRTRTHYLFHAGVVTYGKQAIVIVANSFHGKSTLVYELVRRGLRFYSDDVAPIGLHDTQVYPYPRTLQLRPGALNIIGLDDTQVEPMWRDKYLLSQEGSNPDRLDEAATIRAVVFLRDPTKNMQQSTEPCDSEVMVVLERLSDNLLEAIRQLPDLIKMEIREIGGYPALQIVMPRNSQLVNRIEELCGIYQSAVLYVAKNVQERPSFDRPASLLPLQRSQAALDLLQHWLTGTESALVKEAVGESKIRLYAEVARIIGSANCYELNVGPLQEMADLVMGLVDDEQR